MPCLSRLKMNLVGCLVSLLTVNAFADEAAIRKSFGERLKNFPAIDEIRRSPIPGIYEVRAGTAIYYADEKGDHLLVGSIFDTNKSVNITEVRNNSLAATIFDGLPRTDALTSVKGNGKRHMVVFADPNCSYCKQLESDLAKLNNVTIHTFLFPILGPDSIRKSQNIFCAKENTKVWAEWMLAAKPIPERSNTCRADAIERNVALGRKLKLTGTPALFFEDGKWLKGAADASAIETQLQESAKRKS